MNEIHIFQCMSKQIWGIFQRVSLKYLTYTSKYIFRTTTKCQKLLDWRARVRFWNTITRPHWVKSIHSLDNRVAAKEISMNTGPEMSSEAWLNWLTLMGILIVSQVPNGGWAIIRMWGHRRYWNQSVNNSQLHQCTAKSALSLKFTFQVSGQHIHCACW